MMLATSPATCRIPIYKPAKSPDKKHSRHYKIFTNESESGRAFPLSKNQDDSDDAHC